MLGFVRHIGDTDICEVCHAPYIVTGGGQRYCKDCAPEAVRAVDRKQSLEWYHQNSDTYNPVRNKRRRVVRKKAGES